VLETLYTQATQATICAGRCRGRDRAVIAQGSLFEFDAKSVNRRSRPSICANVRAGAHRRAGFLYPRAQAQRDGVRIGPAGTGKTWLAVAHAAQLFERKEVDRIILSRPAVEAGERLGFLPGDLREKVDPYLRPIYDALYDLMDSRIVERALQAGEIEIAPLAFMRGRTLTNAVIILDEAQKHHLDADEDVFDAVGENSRMTSPAIPPRSICERPDLGTGEAARLLDGVEASPR